MDTTTVHLPKSLKSELERVAREEGRSEADLILEGVRHVVESHGSQGADPKIPLFRSEDPALAERVDDLLQGFGEP